MNHLLRANAPISDAGWAAIDEEARQRLTPALAARRLVDFSGPHGWEHSASNLGRAAEVAPNAVEGITASQRRVAPLMELRADFELSRDELGDVDRGALDPDLGPVDRAAHTIAVAENLAVFRGWPNAVVGIAESSTHERLRLGEPADSYPQLIAGAVEQLLCSGISGPYGLALGGEQYRRVVESAEHGGYPLFEHVRRIIEGPIVWTPGLEGAVVLSLRGGDFLFECGQDLSVGYEGHDEVTVRLYLQESFSFQVTTPEAAVALDAQAA
jgi:uncharacterized linocin/CFP29 family protein